MTRSFVLLSFVAALLAGCAQAPRQGDQAQAVESAGRAESIQRLIAEVRKDPSKKPQLARALMHGTVLMIPDPRSPTLALLFFDQPERAFVPVFSDRKVFDEEAYGSGFEGKAIAVDARRFASLLHGDDVVILNPGHRPAIEFTASELAAAAER
jgi:hypothetical protein